MWAGECDFFGADEAFFDESLQYYVLPDALGSCGSKEHMEHRRGEEGIDAQTEEDLLPQHVTHSLIGTVGLYNFTGMGNGSAGISVRSCLTLYYIEC
jgi:hypothetical protein